MRILWLLLACHLVAPGAAAAGLWQGRTAAFFGVTFIDTSQEGEMFGARDDEAARVEMVEARIAGALREHGLELADLAPVEEELARIVNPAECYGCELRMAQALGADYAIVSEVQKVSNLILAMNVMVRDAETGEEIRGLAVDIRGNTDESWSRGIRYVLERGIFIE
jgi:hypothetical protein